MRYSTKGVEKQRVLSFPQESQQPVQNIERLIFRVESSAAEFSTKLTAPTTTTTKVNSFCSQKAEKKPLLPIKSARTLWKTEKSKDNREY